MNPKTFQNITEQARSLQQQLENERQPRMTGKGTFFSLARRAGTAVDGTYVTDGPSFGRPHSLSSLLQAAQKDPEARRAKIDERGVLTIRRSEAIERQRSIWVFFSSLLEREDHGTKRLQNSR